MTKKIRLLSVIETMGNGGAERALVNMLPEMQKLGIECEVAIIFDTDELARELKDQNIKVHRLNLSYKWNVIEGVIRLNQLLRKNDYDIIHAHLFFAYFYAGLVSLLYSEINTVTTFHNLGYNSYPANTIWKKIRKKIASYVVNNLIDRKVAVSSAVKEHYAHHLGIDQVDVIFNSFPLSYIRSLPDISRSNILDRYLSSNSVYKYFSITPGRLVREKGHSYLIDAIEEANRTILGLCHFIVGSGPLENEIRQQIQEKQLNNIVLISGREQKELFELIQACDFIVVPSVSEGFGMVVGEAMALQKPVIATEIDGILDLVNNQTEALLVPSKDSTALANAIDSLCFDKDLQTRLANNAKEKVKQFDSSIIARQWKEYYESMLSE